MNQKTFVNKLLSGIGLCAFACLAFVFQAYLGDSSVFAQTGAEVTIVEAVDMSAAVTSYMTKVGVVLAAVVGAIFTFLLIRIGVNWIRGYLTK